MRLLPNPFSALIIGSSGTIGAAFVELLENNPLCSNVVGIHRHSEHSIDYQDADSIESCATAPSQEAPFQLIINTIGVLHTNHWMPEKKLDDLNTKQLEELMKINAIGPALTIRHFSKLLDPKHSIMVTLSAKVGSIEDNRLGGWYSYRASKAALNMLIKTASIEWARVLNGRVMGSYGFVGGGKTTVDAGAVMADDLRAQKARILLMLLLQQGTKDQKSLQQAFDK